jgi:predicted  nucleic acid-binding Zn-ribbon protein
MKEIDRLRQRLTNISRNTVEYKMTVKEAKDLVKEFEVLERREEELKEKLEQVKAIPIEPAAPRTLDGGTF